MERSACPVHGEPRLAGIEINSDRRHAHWVEGSWKLPGLRTAWHAHGSCTRADFPHSRARAAQAPAAAQGASTAAVLPARRRGRALAEAAAASSTAASRAGVVRTSTMYRSRTWEALNTANSLCSEELPRPSGACFLTRGPSGTCTPSGSSQAFAESGAKDPLPSTDAHPCGAFSKKRPVWQASGERPRATSTSSSSSLSPSPAVELLAAAAAPPTASVK
mmetsp:Transcript_53443/g.168213  ORF Transcript_53443/g.168213 Transcript_53443/m.168213 type:complete len:220 (-) Transcript_53443:1272-1931(-)